MGTKKPATKGDLVDLIVGAAVALLSFWVGVGPILRAIYPVRRSDAFSAIDFVIPIVCLLLMICGIKFLARGIVALIRGDWPA
jgi:hypothetical protein